MQFLVNYLFVHVLLALVLCVARTEFPLHFDVSSIIVAKYQ